MAMQTGKSGLASVLNAESRKVFEASKAKVEVPQDFGDLPAGISGIARLVRCGFKKVDQVKPGDKSGAKVGDYWFNAMGVVVDPVWYTDDKGNRVRIAGKQTRIIEAVFDTPNKEGERARKTQAEHVEWIMRQLKFLLGGTLESFDANDLEAVCEILTKQKPYFAFSTSSGTQPPRPGQKPMIFHNWQGRVDDFVPEQSDKPMVKDNTGSANAQSQSPNGVHQQPAQSQPANRIVDTGSVERRNVAPTPPNQQFDEFGDIDSLVERASSGDEKAGAELTEMAVSAGVPKSDVEDAADWEAVGVLIKDQQSEGAAVEEVDENDDPVDNETGKPVTPKIGTVYKYKGKGMKRAVDVECIKVNTKQSKCTLKDMSSEKEYADVPFADVLPPA